MQRHVLNLEQQHAQRILAKEVCELVHGKSESERAEFQSQILFDDGLDKFSPEQIAEIFTGDKRFIKLDINLMDDIAALGAASGILPSKSAVNKMIKSGGFYVNDKKWIASQSKVVDPGLLVNGKILLLRSGKSNYRIVCLG
jgi:tyrosyl-tRNA synthetase